MDVKDIEQLFNNEKNIYYGHGIGDIKKSKEISEKIRDSIFEKGLRTSHYALEYTTLPLR